MHTLKDLIITDHLGRKYKMIPIDESEASVETAEIVDKIEKTQQNRGNIIKEERIRAGISQEKLAELSGLTQATISRIETGEANPRDKNFEKMLYILRKAHETI